MGGEIRNHLSGRRFHGLFPGRGSKAPGIVVIESKACPCHVAALLGHRDLATTMVYTEQDALDLIRAKNMASPGLIAEQVTVSPA